MATQTTHFDLTKQQSNERVSVGLLNDNFDIIDGVMFANQEKSEQLADEYNASETYNTDDYVRRENYLYKCLEDNVTGTWDATKWDRVKVMDEITQGGGGGSSTLAGLNDVNISSPTDGQALVYDNATQKWVNRAGGGGSSTFAGLNDVDVAGVANKDIARFNSTTQKWEKSPDLTNLELTVSQISASTLGITDGHTILKSDGTAMAQEDDLQFASGCVEDDAVNGKTIYIEMIRISQENYNTLKANGQLKPGAKYFIYDAQPVAINASNLPYSSSQSTKQKIDEVDTLANSKQSEFVYHNGRLGAGAIALPSEWTEIIAQVEGNQGALLTSHFLRPMVSNTAVMVSLGNFGTSYSVGQLNKDNIWLNAVNWAGQDITSTSHLYVYVR